PIGAFLIEHIISNFETWNGPLAYAKQVLFLNSLPLVRVLEWTFIFIPLAFHALYGLWIAFRGRTNVNVYPWAGNWAYVMQRITGIIAFIYIIQHVLRQRFMGVSLPENPQMAFHKVQVELSNPWMLAVYIIAMIAVSWHFAYGIWLFAAKWGITPGAKARRKFGWVCTAGGLVLCTMGLMSIYAVVYKYPNAPIPVLATQPAAITAPAPTAITPGITNPAPPSQVQ
ncbi:MAG: succinate dehydrogenase, partial [Edaphobacter sp.]